MLTESLTKRLNLRGDLNSKTAIYDLSDMPTTFDFAVFCVIAKTLGAEEVRFVYNGEISTRKYPEDYAWRRWANICIPTCRLVGLKYSLGPLVNGFTHWYHYGCIEGLYKELNRVELLKLPESISPKDGEYVTVTLRDSIRNKWRDSDIPSWKRFIDLLRSDGWSVEVLGDCEFAPMSIEYRMSVYAGAKMNFGSSNGPMALCHFSDMPYITSNMIPRHNPGNAAERLKNYMAHGGFPYGSQFSFRNPKTQLIQWEYDTFDNLVKAYEWWKNQD